MKENEENLGVNRGVATFEFVPVNNKKRQNSQIKSVMQPNAAPSTDAFNGSRDSKDFRSA